MAQVVRMAWRTTRLCLAGGFLLSTAPFLLLIVATWHNVHQGIAAQRATGLAAVSGWEPISLWQESSIFASSRRKQSPGGIVGGVPGGIPRAQVANAKLASPAENIDRQIIRSGTLDIIAGNPLQAADQLRDLAARLSGFVVSSKVSGSDEQTRSAQVTIRISADRFDGARAEVRKIAQAVEEDSVEARDVTREYVDQEATLRNYRSEEVQYLAILKHATAVKDVVEVTSKLADVRGRIDGLEADLRFLRQQVEMSLLTTNVRSVAEAQVLGIRWRPLYEAKLSLHGALSALADYADSMLALVLYLPVILIWAITIVSLLKIGWMVLRRIGLLFFPGLKWWSRKPVQSQAT